MAFSRLLVPSLALALSSACASTAEPDLLPPPFTADQIRAASPAGKTLHFRVTDGAGERTTGLRFVECDAEGAVIETWVLSEDGEETERRRSPKVSWAELRDHARFDPTRAVRKRARLVISRRPFDGWLYTVLGDDGLVTHFYFAVDRPGPPVRMEQKRNRERILLQELVEGP